MSLVNLIPLTYGVVESFRSKHNKVASRGCEQNLIFALSITVSISISTTKISVMWLLTMIIFSKSHDLMIIGVVPEPLRLNDCWRITKSVKILLLIEPSELSKKILRCYVNIESNINQTYLFIFFIEPKCTLNKWLNFNLIKIQP